MTPHNKSEFPYESIPGTFRNSSSILAFQMLHLSWSGGRGLGRETYLVWLFGTTLTLVSAWTAPGGELSFSTSMASPLPYNPPVSFAILLMRLSRGSSGAEKISTSTSIGLGVEVERDVGVCGGEREGGLLAIGEEGVSVSLLGRSTRGSSERSKSTSTSWVDTLSVTNGAGDSFAGGVAATVGIGSPLGLCRSRRMWDWRRAYRWLGRLSNWTVRRDLFCAIVCTSVRPLWPRKSNNFQSPLEIQEYNVTVVTTVVSLKLPDLYLKREPIRKKFCLALGAFAAALSLKKVWCSTAHFQRCFAAFSLCNLQKRSQKVSNQHPHFSTTTF